MECYQAFKEGRADTDPSEGWYKGEIGFFDFYIIPLARKLKDCGVFGVSSDEYLNYALKNRQEWVDRGQEVLSEMIEKTHAVWAKKKLRKASKEENNLLILRGVDGKCWHYVQQGTTRQVII